MRELPVLLSSNEGAGYGDGNGYGGGNPIDSGDGGNGGGSVDYGGNSSIFFTESLAELLNA